MNKFFKAIYYIINIIGILLTIGGFILTFYIGVTGLFFMGLGATISILNIMFFWLIKFFQKKGQ